MVESAERLKDNVSGPYYVTDGCLGCGACAAVSPACFKVADAGGYAYVYHQPEDEDEIEQCEAAYDICPAHVIHKDSAVA